MRMLYYIQSSYTYTSYKTFKERKNIRNMLYYMSTVFALRTVQSKQL